MSEETAPRLLEGHRLKGASNYLQWSTIIMDILESKSLEHTILPSFIQPTISSDETDSSKIAEHQALLKTWKAHNGKAKVAIRMNC